MVKCLEKVFSLWDGALIEVEAILFLLGVLAVWKGAREFLMGVSPLVYFGAWLLIVGFLIYKIFKKK